MYLFYFSATLTLTLQMYFQDRFIISRKIGNCWISLENIINIAAYILLYILTNVINIEKKTYISEEL